jgi:hypothetical protein
LSMNEDARKSTALVKYLPCAMSQRSGSLAARTVKGWHGARREWNYSLVKVLQLQARGVPKLYTLDKIMQLTKTLRRRAHHTSRTM